MLDEGRLLGHEQRISGPVERVLLLKRLQIASTLTGPQLALVAEQIGERFGVDLRTVPVVGDTPRDLVAGVAVGCLPHLVLTGRAASLKGQPLPPAFPAHTRVHQDLGAFADWLIAKVPAPPRPA